MGCWEAPCCVDRLPDCRYDDCVSRSCDDAGEDQCGCCCCGSCNSCGGGDGGGGGCGGNGGGGEASCESRRPVPATAAAAAAAAAAAGVSPSLPPASSLSTIGSLASPVVVAAAAMTMRADRAAGARPCRGLPLHLVLIPPSPCRWRRRLSYRHRWTNSKHCGQTMNRKSGQVSGGGGPSFQ